MDIALTLALSSTEILRSWEGGGRDQDTRTADRAQFDDECQIHMYIQEHT